MYTEEEKRFHKLRCVFKNKEIRSKWSALKWSRFKRQEAEEHPDAMSLGATHEERVEGFKKQLEMIVNEAYFIERLHWNSTRPAQTETL